MLEWLAAQRATLVISKTEFSVNAIAPQRPKARLPRGFADCETTEARALARMLEVIRATFERYGFDPLETPILEYTDALGKFLPDQDRPNEGVFSLRDDDAQWLSLRYDLTAPLARFVAEHFERMPKPYRSYRCGYVFRNEKPGPGRFRQFMQFDADTVAAPTAAADAEMAMLMADTLEAVGIPRGKYVVKINSRKILDGLMESIGLGGMENARRRLTVLRAIDKLDRLGLAGVRALLGPGRKDESGDFTEGAGLGSDAIEALVAQLSPETAMRHGDQASKEGLVELNRIRDLCREAGYLNDRIVVDTSIVRGLEYYTGPVYEAEVTFPVTNEAGETVRFGSVAGGGRYDGLVGRFRGDDVPATGFSIGVSRLFTALRALNDASSEAALGPIVVIVFDRDNLAAPQALTSRLRAAGIRAEMYLGAGGLKAQMKYADRRNAPCVVLQGEDERAAGTVQIKDLAEGKRLSETIADNATWRESRPAQVTVAEGSMVDTVRRILAAQARASQSSHAGTRSS